MFDNTAPINRLIRSIHLHSTGVDFRAPDCNIFKSTIINFIRQSHC